MDQIEAALRELTLQDTPNITAVAKKHGCNRTTLSRRFRKVTVSKHAAYNKQKFLDDIQSKSLIKYINDLTERGLPPTVAMVRNIAAGIAGRLPGVNWASRWIQANKNEIKSAYLTPIDKARKKADSALYYSLYFELIGQKMTQYNILPENIYNMDEKGFLIGFLQKARRVFTKEAFDSGRLRNISQDGNREWITVLATICADGTTLSPGLIYQAVSGNIQDSWLQDFDPKQQSCFFASSPTGWTNDDLGYSWLTTVFDRETKGRARNGRDWRLLIVDGHGSHINMRFIDYCHLHRILLAVYPPHSTHRLQPLDVSLFSPLATFYSQELDQFSLDSEGLTRLTKRDFFRLFWAAYKKAFIAKNIQSGWQRTGLYPFEPYVVLAKFQQKEPTTEERPLSSDSNKSVLSARDWVRIEAKLQEVVTNVFDSRVKLLSNTIKHLSTSNILLESRILGYQRALQNEQKKRQRQKPLFHQLAAQSEGRAVFYSPQKVQQARDLVQKKEDAKKQDEALKADKRLQLQLQKQEKRHLVEERKMKRMQNKVERERENTAKKVTAQNAKEAKQLDQQLLNDLKRSEKSKRTRNPLILPTAEAVNSTRDEAEAIEVKSSSGRPQRQRRVPEKLK
jgi:hypothetical protein